MPQNDQALLTRLRDSGLEFVVVGGVSAVYHGATIATFDLDICCPFGEGHVSRIESSVKDLHPVHRLTANKLPLEMTRSAFASLKNLYLQTDLGKLDCLSEIAGVGDFEAVKERSIIGKLSYGEFRILNIARLSPQNWLWGVKKIWKLSGCFVLSKRRTTGRKIYLNKTLLRTFNTCPFSLNPIQKFSYKALPEVLAQSTRSSRLITARKWWPA